MPVATELISCSKNKNKMALASFASDYFALTKAGVGGYLISAVLNGDTLMLPFNFTLDQYFVCGSFLELVHDHKITDHAIYWTTTDFTLYSIGQKGRRTLKKLAL